MDLGDSSTRNPSNSSNGNSSSDDPKIGSGVLLVDSEESLAQALERLLAAHGIQCTVCYDCDAAKKRLDENEYDVVISDLKVDGTADLEFLRGIAKTKPGLPMILTTGYPTVESAIQAFDLPVAAYLPKPVDQEKLISAVRHSLARRKLRRAVEGTLQRLGTFSEALEAKRQLLTDPARHSIQQSVQTLVAYHTELITVILRDINFLFGAVIDAYGSEQFEKNILHPILQEYRAIISDALAVIQRTKSSFKSKELGELRKRLETFLEKDSGESQVEATNDVS